MPHTKQHERKQITGSGVARRGAEDIDSRRSAIDAAVEAAVSGKSANAAKKKEVRKGRDKASKADPSLIQRILDLILG